MHQFHETERVRTGKYSLNLWAYWRLSFLQSVTEDKFKIPCKIIPAYADYPLRLMQGVIYILEHQNYPDKKNRHRHISKHTFFNG